MNEHRRRMMAAFGDRLVPALRGLGFKGSMPHFRRRSPGRVDYLTVQFSSRGGRFVIELGRSGPDGFDEGPWRELAVDEIDPSYCGLANRRRLEPRGRGLSNPRWWVFGPASTDDPHPPGAQAHYEAVAEDSLAVFLAEGEPWFALGLQPEPEKGPREAPRPAREGLLHRILPWNRPQLRIACVMASSDPPLHKPEHWSRIEPAMTALVERLPRPTNINSFQTRPGADKALKFGMMRWSEENNRRWTREYLDGPEPAEFHHMELWSPSRRSSVEQRKDPEFFARLEYHPLLGEQAFILALRLDQLAAAGAAADAVIEAVRALLPDSKCLICDRRWEERAWLLGTIKQNNLDDVPAGSAFEYAERHPKARKPGFAA